MAEASRQSGQFCFLNGRRPMARNSPDTLLTQDGDGATPGTSGSGRSVVGSEQRLGYTPYLRGVWPQRWV
jgi:hypothetical protein